MNSKSSLLPRISVLRPVSVTMCLVALLVLGAVAYVRMPVEMMPDGLTPPFLAVSVGFRNASPQETEQQITLPLE
ncbi:MAG: efflux RND transporter permease subunit, partial [Gemmatimonadota bacterium]|nr:efflux RND transporter permease subunit [Gemmatimonadota bacterium]